MRPAHWFLSYDLYERHQVVARLIAAHGAQDRQVLDVGGRIGLLQKFVPCRVISVNVDGSGDVQYAGEILPFARDSFDIVVAIDTLEHIPRLQRPRFVSECLRVSRNAIMLAAPFGSPGHAEAEARLNDLFEQLTGKAHRYLSEHILYGLPDTKEIQDLIVQSEAQSFRLLFAGDYRRESRFFEAAMRSSLERGLPARLTALAWHVRSRALFNRLTLSETPLPYSNRFFLELLKPCATSSPAAPAS
ncbi:MAG: class I SAM-dependent methyltransferase [Anaerolineae bacterium]